MPERRAGGRRKRPPARPASTTSSTARRSLQRLLQLGAVLRRVGIGVIAVFFAVAGIIISNTIRLTVFARRREIAIMQLVGATNTYIRLPFICEGLLDGVVGALLALGVLAVARVRALAAAARSAAVGAAYGDAGRRASAGGRAVAGRRGDRRRRVLDLGRTPPADVASSCCAASSPLHVALAFPAIARGRLDASSSASRPSAPRRSRCRRACTPNASELHAVTLRYKICKSSSARPTPRSARSTAASARSTTQQASTQRRHRLEHDPARCGAALAAAARRLLKRRLVDIYEYGDLSYVNALIAARSFSEFVERWEDLRLLIAANERAVRARKAAEARVAAVEADLERDAASSCKQQEQAQDEARSQLGSLADERRNLVELAGDQRHSVARKSPRWKISRPPRRRRSKRLILERERELEAQRRAAGIAGGVESASGSPGTFSWPVTGTITSPFGWRSNPVRRRARVPSRARHRRADRDDRHGGRRRNRYHGAVVRRLRQLHPHRSRRRLLDRLRPSVGDLRLHRADRSSAARRSARSARPGSRPGPTFISRSELQANRLTRRPACIKT